jgi:hypothetical protein
MQYIDALLFSSLLLLTIPTTGFLSWFLGIEDIPDKYTMIGGSVLLIGIGLITYSEHHRGEERARCETLNETDATFDGEIQLPELKKRDLSSSPLSIASVLQAASPLQYSQLHQVDEDEEAEH